MPPIAFAGLGRMGLPMCAGLVRAGYQVTATDARAEAEEAAVACGAVWRDTPAQAAAAAEVLVTMLPGPREVRAAMLGKAGALNGLAAGTTWIDMTSNSPAGIRPIRERAIGQGVEVLEAPVGGGIAAAREGKLQLFVGGEAAAVERHRALLEVLGDPGRIVHVGGHGTGYAAKLLVNLLWFGQAVATAEALLLGQQAGIAPAALEHALAGSAAASTFIRRDIGFVFQGDYLTSFGLDRICEELEAVSALADHYQVPHDLSDLVRRTYRRALARYGPVDGELLAVALLEEEAGHKLRPGGS
ncbi:MAG: NAD(P)-dependent oxidoreductase [Actinobacteria bacterium]|nr:NAD(P)-dependent oxidoreductase [Actinomycetota bacterium]